MSSIGKDLARIRHFKKLTLQELHTKTRISLEILETLEAGKLLAEPLENEVYARSYTRTVARAMGIADEVITEALDQQKSGAYEGMLLELFPGIVDKTSVRHLSGSDTEASGGGDDEKKPVAEETSSRDTTDETSSGDAAMNEPKDVDSGSKTADESPESDSGSDTESDTAGGPDKTADSGKSTTDRPTATKSTKGAKSKGTPTPSTPRGKKTTDQVDWAAMGQRFSSPSKRSSGWVLGLGLVLVFVAATLWIAFQTDLLESLMEGGDEPQKQVEETSNETPDSDGAGGIGLELGEGVDAPSSVSPVDGADAEGPAPTRLDTTLYLTIYGAYGPLDPVRVWSDLKPRFDPYWVEEGQAMQFEFRDTIRVRSQYEESLLFLNGRRIDDAREQYYNQDEQSVELTRSLFSPQSEWAAPRELELPDSVAVPDTIRMRPIFN